MLQLPFSIAFRTGLVLEIMYLPLHALRIPNFFSGIWQWMRLLCHFDILPAAPQHLAVEALLHTGTVHVLLLLVFFSRLHGCETYQSSHPSLHTEYMLIPFLA